MIHRCQCWAISIRSSKGETFWMVLCEFKFMFHHCFAVWYKRAGEGEIGSVLFRDQVDVPSEGQIKGVLMISN